NPWSCSPIGPAPTRVPRIALPPVAISDALQLREQTQRDDGDEPGQREDHREPVEVALGKARRAHGRGHAAAEHVRQSPAAPLVEQDQQSEQEARDAEHHLQDELKDFHASRLSPRPSGRTGVKYTGGGAAGWVTPPRRSA